MLENLLGVIGANPLTAVKLVGLASDYGLPVGIGLVVLIALWIYSRRGK